MESDKVSMQQEKKENKKVLGKPTSDLRKSRAADDVAGKPSVVKGSELTTSNSPNKKATTSNSSRTKNEEEVADSKEKNKTSGKEAKNVRVVDSSEESTESSDDSSSSESSESDNDGRDTGVNKTKAQTAARGTSAKVQTRKNQTNPGESVVHPQIGAPGSSKQQEKLHSKEFQTPEFVSDESDDSVEKIQNAGKPETGSLTAAKKSVAAVVSPRNDLTEVNVKTVEGTGKHETVGKAAPHSQSSPADKKRGEGPSVLAKNGSTRSATATKNPPSPPNGISKPIIQGQNDLNKNVGDKSKLPPKLAPSMPGKLELGLVPRQGPVPPSREYPKGNLSISCRRQKRIPLKHRSLPLSQSPRVLKVPLLQAQTQTRTQDRNRNRNRPLVPRTTNLLMSHHLRQTLTLLEAVATNLRQSLPQMKKMILLRR